MTFIDLKNQYPLVYKEVLNEIIEQGVYFAFDHKDDISRIAKIISFSNSKQGYAFYDNIRKKDFKKLKRYYPQFFISPIKTVPLWF